MGESKDKKIGQVVLETLALERKQAEIMAQIDVKKQEIQKYFDENGLKKIEVSPRSNDAMVVAKKMERVYMKYDVKALKKKLGPEIFLEISRRSYNINDIDGLIKLLQSAGIKAKEFKKFIDVDIKIDNSEIKRLYDAKEISMEDLKGCYSATISKSIKIEESKGGSD